MNDIQKFEKRSEKSVAVVDANSPAALMRIALTQGESLERIEKMLELQEKWDGLQAKKAYTEAMAEFKKDPPRIERDKTVEYQVGNKTTKYTHADLASASEKINRALSMHGLSASWKTSQENGTITITCTITHELGHSESTSLTALPDTSGSKNPIQAIGSTISYLERYTLLALTGLAAHGIDDDGISGGEVEYITEKQLSTIIDFINEKEVDQTKFLKYMKAESLETILARDFNKAVNALKKKKPVR